MNLAKMRSISLRAAVGAGVVIAIAAAPAHATRFTVTNLVSDGFVPAVTIDPDLINPWGISYGPTGPFWVSDNATGVSTLYNGAGAKLGLTVAVAPPVGGSPPASPTGQVFNGSASSFNVTNGASTAKALFLFATEDGTISGWSPALGIGNSFLAVDNSSMGAGAVYKGLAIGNSGGADYLYAADFRNGVVEQFDGNFNLVRAFTDPGVAAGYAPFNTQVLGGHLFVTYALQDADKKDDVGGAGNGYVDEFNLDGTFDKRLVSAGGEINSPWGLDIAPSTFGAYAGDLLVGNFGDGTISAFDPTSGTFKGKLLGTDGNPLVLGDLWGLINGNGAAGGDTGKVYFTAAIADEAHGLFGSLTAVPEPSSWAMMLVGFAGLGGMLRRRRAESRMTTLI